MSGRIKADGWNEKFIGGNKYEFTPDTNFVTMTGSEETKDLPINSNFRIVKVEWQHTDNSTPPVADYVQLDWSIKKSGLSGLFSLIAKGSVQESDIIILLGTRFEYSNCILRFGWNTTNTDRVYPVVTIQLLR